MAKTIKDPKEIFRQIRIDYEGAYGENLVSIILYGSAVGEDYRPGKSDVNFMIVLSEEGIDQLERAFPLIKKWQKRNVAIPLFLTETYVASSMDVFPIEYFNFQRDYELVFGKDILKDLSFDAELIRLQCEREIKGKLLLLREAFLESSGNGRVLKKVIGHSIPALMAIFEALLYLKGAEIPKQKRELVRITCKAFSIEAGVFEKLLEIKEGKRKIGRVETGNLFKEYLKEMRKLSKRVDALGG